MSRRSRGYSRSPRCIVCDLSAIAKFLFHTPLAFDAVVKVRVLSEYCLRILRYRLVRKN